MIPSFIYLERSLLQFEMLVLARHLSQARSLDDFTGLLRRMAALQERLLVSSRHARWPTGFDMAATLLGRMGVA